MGRNLIVLADGTGNSAGKLFKTNVWRLYQALDLTPRAAPDDVQQIAYYHDGVGTSSFKPLAILGGAFGWGLKRNVLDLYKFLCRNYVAGDRIYAFGFSRGAFTVRVLIGLIVSQGLYRCRSESQLDRVARDAYRVYRRRLSGRAGTWLRNLVPPRNPGRTAARGCTHLAVNEIELAFVGVWDTVAAYGMPIAELTRGIDRWIWPLSLPDRNLSKWVKRARHALSLDDERDTFHPLLWDEHHEAALVADEKSNVDANRLRQVWFSGMHSDVGGGYPDDGLSNVTLAWMMEEAGAQLGEAVLSFQAKDLDDVKAAMDLSAPMHDSRRGLAGYYRYQPRKVGADLPLADDPSTLIMRNPDLGPKGLLKSVNIHESVFQRMRRGPDRYGPIVIPAAYNVIGPGCAIAERQEREADAKHRARVQEWVWNDVWRKRIAYFAMVGVSLLIAAMPLVTGTNACLGPFCLLSPIISLLGGFLPGFAGPWIEAFATSPALFLGLVAVLGFLLGYSAKMHVRIHDGMGELWRQSLDPPISTAPPAPERAAAPSGGIYALRNAKAYRYFWQGLKWRVAPAIFAFALMGFAVTGVLALLAAGADRIALWREGESNSFCRPDRVERYVAAAAESRGAIVPAGGKDVFLTRYPCWPVGEAATTPGKYRITVTVLEPWFDSTIETGPSGFASDRMPFYLRYTGFLVRRSVNARWFQPLLRIVGTDGSTRTEPLEMRRSDEQPADPGDKGAPVYSAEVEIARPGELYLFVNDAVLFAPEYVGMFYGNNRGAARIKVDPAPSR